MALVVGVCGVALLLFVLLRHRAAARPSGSAEHVLAFIDSPLGKATIVGVVTAVVISELGIVQAVREDNLQRTRSSREEAVSAAFAAIRQVEDAVLALTLLEPGEDEALRAVQRDLIASQAPLEDAHVAVYLHLCNLEPDVVDTLFHGPFLLHRMAVAGSWHLSDRSGAEFAHLQGMLASAADQIRWLVSFHVKTVLRDALDAMQARSGHGQRQADGLTCETPMAEQYDRLWQLQELREQTDAVLVEASWDWSALGASEEAQAFRQALAAWRSAVEQGPWGEEDLEHAEALRRVWADLPDADLEFSRRVGMELETLRSLTALLEHRVLVESRRWLIDQDVESPP
jgi:hypothetical protein